MNSFYEHHKHNIQWHYRCFDRILLNGLIQPFQQPERVIGFFNTYRQLYPVTRHTLRHIAEQFQRWVTERAAKRKIPVIEAPRGRRDEFVDPYFERAKPDQVVVILKAREPARIMIAIGDKAANRWHLQIADRWVTQYNFYINDKVWGRMFVRICPYLPFSARVCLNQHHWLANRMRQQGIAFKQLGNAFLKCTAPDRLQKLADSLAPRDLVTCGQKWLAHLTPFFTANERQHAGCQHRLFFSQVEFCDNLIFRRRAALDKLGERLLDANRTIGQPDKITVIFGRKITKQYVRDHLILRTEPASNNVKDYGVNKAVENLSVLRNTLSAITDNYLKVQQDILETFIDRGELRKLAQPTITSTGKRVPGLKLDNPRQLAVMHALVRFAHIAAANTLPPQKSIPSSSRLSDPPPERYSLSSLRYDLSKLRAKGLLTRLPHSRRYQLSPQGYSISLVFLKLFERIYAPLTAGLLNPFRADTRLQHDRRTQLDRLYQRVADDLDALVRAVGLNLKAA